MKITISSSIETGMTYRTITDLKKACKTYTTVDDYIAAESYLPSIKGEPDPVLLVALVDIFMDFCLKSHNVPLNHPKADALKKASSEITEAMYGGYQRLYDMVGYLAPLIL